MVESITLLLLTWINATKEIMQFQLWLIYLLNFTRNFYQMSLYSMTNLGFYQILDIKKVIKAPTSGSVTLFFALGFIFEKKRE